ncbi:nagb/rpia/CoA transferase-like protein [Anaeromyces robustus]|uniref:Nagb/rpia/CoA transferase-like protein n=1 Tax=Anaeromyces robustus TaxID=1754192 RepID=A0A1Y1X7P4_9FUNG|nr:nagb/rpia/CoA transferase-like protein [Anaeromyces robustus]|eukprot:ORX81781.1 nagb/rpia/CoA transferase-like protein [Anaeromyces robustus]
MNFYSSLPISKGSIRYSRGKLEVINQLLLPFEVVYEPINGVKDGYRYIQSLKVQAGQAVALVSILSLAVEIHNTFYNDDILPPFNDKESAVNYIYDNLDYIRSARQTPFTLNSYIDIVWEAVIKENDIANDAEDIFVAYLERAESLLDEVVENNKRLSYNGEKYILDHCLKYKNISCQKVKVVTHGNFGEFSCLGVGTALGIIRQLNKSEYLEQTYCTETRPYNNGSRITAFELLSEKIPCTLVCDSMLSSLFSETKIDVIIVGAERIAANGDVVSTIGTYQLAILAKFFNIQFIVAAPSAVIDLKSKTGKDIEIENFSELEVTQIRGEVVEDEGNVKEPMMLFNSPTWDEEYSNDIYEHENNETSELYTEGFASSESSVSDEEEDEEDDDDFGYDYDMYSKSSQEEEEEEEEEEGEREGEGEEEEEKGKEKEKDKDKDKDKVGGKEEIITKKEEKEKEKEKEEEEEEEDNDTTFKSINSYDEITSNHSQQQQHDNNDATSIGGNDAKSVTSFDSYRSQSSMTSRNNNSGTNSSPKVFTRHTSKKDFSLNTQTLITKLGQNVIDVLEGIEERMRFNVHGSSSGVGSNNYQIRRQSSLEPPVTSMTVKVSTPDVHVYAPAYDM